jgi:hypothetical protein
LGGRRISLAGAALSSGFRDVSHFDPASLFVWFLFRFSFQLGPSMINYVNSCLSQIKSQVQSQGVGFPIDQNGRPIDYSSRPIDPIFRKAQEQLDKSREYKLGGGRASVSPASLLKPAFASASPAAANEEPTNASLLQCPIGISASRPRSASTSGGGASKLHANSNTPASSSTGDAPAASSPPDLLNETIANAKESPRAVDRLASGGVELEQDDEDDGPAGKRLRIVEEEEEATAQQTNTTSAAATTTTAATTMS